MGDESPLARPDLLELLDREIEEAYRQAHRPGWTPWALLTALVAMLWGAANRIDQVTSPVVVFRSLVVALMVVEVLQRGRQLLSPTRDSEDESRVLVSSDVLGVTRPALALQLIYAGVLFWGLTWSSHGAAPWSNIAVFLWVGLMGLGGALGLLYSAWPVPLSIGTWIAFPLQLFFAATPLLFPILGAVGYAESIAGQAVIDIRVGLLLGVAAALLLELAREPDAPPLVGELAELRRQVSFGTIQPAEAVQSATIILRGLKLEEYVQQDARRMLRAMESLRSATTRFQLVVAEIDGLASQLEAGAGRDSDSWRRLLAQWEREGGEATRRFERAERWQRRYAERLHFAASMAHHLNMPYEGELLVEEIRPRVESVTTEYKRVVDQYRVALERLRLAARNAGLVK